MIVSKQESSMRVIYMYILIVSISYLHFSTFNVLLKWIKCITAEKYQHLIAITPCKYTTFTLLILQIVNLYQYFTFFICFLNLALVMTFCLFVVYILETDEIFLYSSKPSILFPAAQTVDHP